VSLLTALGMASLVFVIAFTWHACMSSNQGPGQTRKQSMIEAWTNIVIGFSVNYVANYLFLPLIGASFTMAENFWIGWLYTAISIIRQYVIRRFYNRRHR
jgi:hypothetical protein